MIDKEERHKGGRPDGLVDSIPWASKGLWAPGPTIGPPTNKRLYRWTHQLHYITDRQTDPITVTLTAHAHRVMKRTNVLNPRSYCMPKTFEWLGCARVSALAYCGQTSANFYYTAFLYIRTYVDLRIIRMLR